MAGGQQINSAQGTLVAVGGDNNVALSGSASTSAIGSTGVNLFLLLKSRKIGVGSAIQALSGIQSVIGQGTVGYAKGFALTGQAGTLGIGQLGTLGQATLSWNPNSEPYLAGYRVYHGTVSGTYPDQVDVGNVVTYQWNALTRGQTHFFAITAYDTSNNESLKSSEVSKAV